MMLLTMVIAALAAPEKVAPPAERTGLEQPGAPATNPATWVTRGEYPARAMRERREGTTGFRLTYDATGQVQKCEIVSSSGHADLDTTTCDLAMLRARFQPGKDAAGKAVGGTYSNRVRWSIPDAVPGPLPFSSPGQMTVEYTVDALGAVTACKGRAEGLADLAGGDTAAVDPCREIQRMAPYQPARDKEGKPLSRRYRVNIEVAIDDIAP